VLRRLDLGVHIALDLDQVEQVAAGQEFKRLISGELEPCSAEAGVALGEPVADLVERPQSMPTPFSAFLRRRYSPEGLPKPCRKTTAAALGAGTRQALRYTHPVSPPKAGMTSPAFPIGHTYKCPEPPHTSRVPGTFWRRRGGRSLGRYLPCPRRDPDDVPDFLMIGAPKAGTTALPVSHREPAGGSPG
jgi:hypothetical protein